jgi:hypothetical protein
MAKKTIPMTPNTMDPARKLKIAQTPLETTTKIKDTLINVSGIAMRTKTDNAEKIKEKPAQIMVA